MVDMTKFKDIYLNEAEDHIQKLNDNLLLLEKKPGDKSLLDELMRSSHTLKGSSAAMGYVKTAFLTHVMEDVFDYARNNQLAITPKIIGILFQTVDALEKTIDSIKKKDEEIDVEIQANALKEITGVTTEGVGKSIRDASGKPIVDKKKPPVIETDPAPEKVADDSRATGQIEYIKVPVERLDRLMALMEELIIDKMKLVETAKELSSLSPLSDHLDRLVSDLQYQIMQARLVPVEQIFARFPRLVRDTATQMKKQIDFQMVGGEIELDRTIVDKLAEPLVHLLKNAVDHGIDSSGAVRLAAAREKEFAIITVEDNGRGIDWGKVRQAAVARGISPAEEAGRLDKAGLINLLYNGRLSTHETVTETSGRGIGLSVVKNFVEQNGGRISVESPLAVGLPGEALAKTGGTRFTLELPLSMAIISSLLVEVNGHLFAIPFSVIERSVRVAGADIKSMADQDVAVIDEQNVPLVYLSKLFSNSPDGELKDIQSLLKEAVDQPEVISEKNIASPKSVLAVLLRRGTESAGLVVDALREELEIIVKPLPPVLRKTKGFSGSTILGDGRTILIVDAMSLLEDTSKLVRTT